MWRSGETYGMQADSTAATGWEDHRGASAACVSRDRRPASRATAGGLDHAIDGDGDCLSTWGDSRVGGFRASARHVSAHGWGAHCERCRLAGPEFAGGDSRSGRRCAHLWRHEKWNDGRRGGGFLPPGLEPGLSIPAEAGHAIEFENAVCGGTV